ncbi:MAG: glycosyltransferase family 4 protein [Roseobacter sp.]
MKLLFVHQNMPGQYREIIQVLAASRTHEIAFLSQRKAPSEIGGVQTVVYKPHHGPGAQAYGLSKVWEAATGAGYGAVTAARALEKEQGFKPDIIIGHVGWGELTFFKQLWPDVPIIGYFEYYYQLEGGIVGYDPSEPVSENTPYLLQARNAVPLANIETVDQGQCPTLWQRDRFPTSFHDRMYVCHDGIRSDKLKPDPGATLTLGRLEKPISREDEIVTYIARNLETVRGFHVMMRALPRILKSRPTARVLIIGGNETSYGGKSSHPGGLRAQMEAEVGEDVDWSRVHFLGRVAYEDFCKVIQISRCHIYLTMPFVLSWSLMESMAMQSTLIASDVAPVREMITHNKTGLLVDFHQPDALADQVIDVLKSPAGYTHLGPAARSLITQKHDFFNCCLPEHFRQINALVPTHKHLEIPKPVL